jgi:hypothetical protein
MALETTQAWNIGHLGVIESTGGGDEEMRCLCEDLTRVEILNPDLPL